MNTIWKADEVDHILGSKSLKKWISTLEIKSQEKFLFK